MSASQATDAASTWVEDGMCVRRLRGCKMQSTVTLMDEVAAALQFPHYFGENWAALDECLSDMEWLLPTRAFVVLVGEAAAVLRNETTEELAAFVAVLGKASAAYGSPVDEGEWWDRPAVPFHCVLQDAPARMPDVARRWSRAGAVLERLADSD